MNGSVVVAKRHSLADRIRAFVRPVPPTVITTSLDEWLESYGKRGWDVHINHYPEFESYRYQVSMSADQNGGPLRCEMRFSGKGATLGKAIEDIEARVGNAVPDFAAAHEARKPKASIVSGTTPAGRRTEGAE